MVHLLAALSMAMWEPWERAAWLTWLPPVAALLLLLSAGATFYLTGDVVRTSVGLALAGLFAIGAVLTRRSPSS